MMLLKSVIQSFKQLKKAIKDWENNMFYSLILMAKLCFLIIGILMKL